MIVRHSGRWRVFPKSLTLSGIISANGSPVFYSEAVWFQTDPCCPNHGTPRATPALKYNTPVVRVHLRTNMHSSAPPARPRLFQIGCFLPLQPSLRVPGKHKQQPESFLRTRPHCKCLMLWKWLKSAWHHRTFSCGTIRWKRHSRDWLTSWLIVRRAATVRRVMKHLFSPTLFYLMWKHLKRGPVLRNCFFFQIFNASNCAACPSHTPLK